MTIDNPCQHLATYLDNGYASREHYLECLSQDYNVPLEAVEALSSLLGPWEDFDGLVVAVQDA